MLLSDTRRLPDATRLGAVQLQVSALDASVEYYTSVLGMQVHDRADDHATLGPPGTAAALIELVERAGTSPIRTQSRQGLYHFALLLPDRPSLGRFLAHVLGAGVRTGASDHLVSEAVYLTDPNGLGIEVYADRPRSQWRVVDGQMQMATAPLDSESLRQAAGIDAWSGMPAGTVMGHLHLHVGDMAEASRFYHECLGLDRTVWSYPGALFLSAGGYHHHLGLNTWAGSAPPPSERDAQLLEWRILLPTADDAERAARRIRDAGHAVEQHVGSWLAVDPWGTRLRLATG